MESAPNTYVSVKSHLNIFRIYEDIMKIFWLTSGWANNLCQSSFLGKIHMSLNLTTSSLLENVQLVYVGGDKALALVEKCHYYIST